MPINGLLHGKSVGPVDPPHVADMFISTHACARAIVSLSLGDFMRNSILTAVVLVAACATPAPQPVAPPPLPMIQVGDDRAYLATCETVENCYEHLTWQCLVADGMPGVDAVAAVDAGAGGRILILDQEVQQFAGTDPGAPPQMPSRPAQQRIEQTTNVCLGAECPTAQPNLEIYQQLNDRSDYDRSMRQYNRRMREYEERVANSAPRTEYRVAATCITSPPP